MEMVNLSLTEAYALAYKVLRGNGFSEAHAVAIATKRLAQRGRERLQAVKTIHRHAA